MNKTIVLAAAIIAFGIIAGAYVIGSFNRYAIINSGPFACRLDKLTGKTWQITHLGGEYIVEQKNMFRR